MPRRRTRNRKSTSPLLSPLAKNIAKAALEDLNEGDVGRHIGVTAIGKNVATHRFEADVPGYSGWEWNAVVACASGSTWVTVSELALVPGGKALQAPEWVPYHERILPGDLGPGDVMPPRPGDERLTSSASESAEVVEHMPDVEKHNAEQPLMLSKKGLDQALARWQSGEFGPDSEFAQKSTLKCLSCAFYLPLAQPVGPAFGACANEYSADETVVAHDYGCGAHSATPPTTPLGVTQAQPYDDESIVEVDIDQV
ncbi:DUF3027 domain-containing protein [Corynebacterium felinum]|uniref:DUF3027 domain-containing protein n=1 Tax=Corynebacterium felinum TaxID=131318 RepID=UPI0035B4FE28|nr:DUF3027 domain-containing protein [Corynebacterium felinum]WJY94362.1 hypothetical protein CFELI_03640 [Corynebacterium felinum]